MIVIISHNIDRLTQKFMTQIYWLEFKYKLLLFKILMPSTEYHNKNDITQIKELDTPVVLKRYDTEIKSI